VEAHSRTNQWIAYFTSTENRHALPLFTSLLNIVCAYDPVGYGMPYNHLMFTDSREPLVEVALHVLCATLEGFEHAVAPSDVIAGTASVKPANEVPNNGVIRYKLTISTQSPKILLTLHSNRIHIVFYFVHRGQKLSVGLRALRSIVMTVIVSRRVFLGVCYSVCLSVCLSAFSKCFFSGSSCRAIS